MNNSLQDQLLKAGLVNKNQSRQIKKAKHRQISKSTVKPQSPSVTASQAAQAAKIEKDRALNAKKKARAERKATAAQIRQLIEEHRQPKGNGDVAYHFPHNGKVKHFYISEETRDRLTRGQFAIATLNGRYEVIAAEAAEKIESRDKSRVVYWNQSGARSDEEADYPDHQIPDDLMW